MIPKYIKKSLAALVAAIVVPVVVQSTALAYESPLHVFSVNDVIGGFDGDGDFNTRYFYNVEEIGEAPTPGPDKDRYGLPSEKGWQQSGYEVACHVKRANSIVCRGKGRGIVRFGSK